MRYCTKCGAQLEEGAKQCPKCGYKIELNETSEYKPAQSSVPAQPCPAEDKRSIGFNILSFFIPIAGLIIYLVKKGEKPIQAKSAGKSAITGLITNVVLSILIVLFCFSILGFIGGMARLSGLDVYNNEDDGQIVASSEVTDYDTTTTEAADYSASVGTLDWNNVKVSIDGTNITLPCTYADFVDKTGYALTATETPDEPLGEMEYTMYLTCEASDGTALDITLFNPDTEQKNAKDCMVVGVSVDDFRDNNANVIFPGNLGLGSKVTQESLTGVFGAPDYSYESETNDYWSAEFESPNDVYSSLEIVCSENNIISEISIRNFEKS